MFINTRSYHSPLADFPSVGRDMGRPPPPPPPDWPVAPPAMLPASEGFELLREGGIVPSVVAEVIDTPPSEIPSAAAAKSLDAISGLGSCRFHQAFCIRDISMHNYLIRVSMNTQDKFFPSI